MTMTFSGCGCVEAKSENRPTMVIIMCKPKKTINNEKGRCWLVE